ncbi:hypothetical protein ABH931_004087 [Streptacidiphilus sp. MAP12-33]|uniref:hypothetical protein n=1 Tax=Streptacidiphilus sp. MAP12-33 TaxID=3156266 RepID=UPI003511E863
MTTAPVAPSRQEQRQSRGPEGNTRLTASVGTVLLVLLAVQGFTILSVTRLLTVHFFVGLMLTGPVALKIGTTGYRVYRYYTGDPAYRRHGAPPMALRLLGPLQILLTVAVLATGCTLALVGPGDLAHTVLFLHKAAFYLWVALTSIHVLAHLLRLPRLVTADLRRQDPVSGRALRWTLLTASLATGAVVALAGVHLAANWG